MKTVRAEVGKQISQFAKRQRENTRKAVGSEENHVCINPNSYIAKEIMYQTALLHDILEELRKR